MRGGPLLSLLVAAVLDDLASAEGADQQAAAAELLLDLARQVPMAQAAQAALQRLLALVSSHESLTQSDAAPTLQKTIRCALSKVQESDPQLSASVAEPLRF